MQRLTQQNEISNAEINRLIVANDEINVNFTNMEALLGGQIKENQVSIDEKIGNITSLEGKIASITDEKNNVQLYLTDLVIKLQNSLSTTESLSKIKFAGIICLIIYFTTNLSNITNYLSNY
jgi:hypothetical protein